MNTKPLVKLIKKAEREAPEVQAEIESAGGPNRWSTEVHSWVSDFQQDRPTNHFPPSTVSSGPHAIAGRAHLSFSHAQWRTSMAEAIEKMLEDIGAEDS